MELRLSVNKIAYLYSVSCAIGIRFPENFVFSAKREGKRDTHTPQDTPQRAAQKLASPKWGRVGTYRSHRNTRATSVLLAYQRGTIAGFAEQIERLRRLESDRNGTQNPQTNTHIFLLKKNQRVAKW